MAKKVSVSMPETLFRSMERARRREQKDRQLGREEKSAAAYVRGYEEHPETEEEIAVAESTSRDLFRRIRGE